MDYYLIRKKFVELSGRYDLINADYTDNGADFFLNAGQMFLDRQASSSKMLGKLPQLVTAGTVIVKTPGLRAVKEVWIGTSVDGLYQLDKWTVAGIKGEYGEQLSSITQGDPLYYAPCTFRPYPDTSTTLSLTGYYDIDDLVLDNTHYTYRGIVIAPSPDQSYYLSIVGLFYSPTLSATLATGTWTQTKSYWTECFPDILINAALLKLEGFYRNTEGVKDFKYTLDMDLSGMDADEVEEDIAGVNQMEG